MRLRWSLLPIVAAGFGFGPSALSAQSAKVFDRYSPSIYKVEILERHSSSPSIVGTAFVVDSSGLLITNYHVVTNLVFEPQDYRIRLVSTDGAHVDSVQVLRVDAAHDLAILSARVPHEVPLHFGDTPPGVGDPVFSLGFPLNLSATVVAGSFSGPMPNTLETTFHFTGSLNPGMSGGPTMLADGRVVGVNVATSGNQLSYLVPAAWARALLAEPRPKKIDLLADVRSSLDDVQRQLSKVVSAAGMGETDIEGYRLPKPKGDLFDCSAGPIQNGDFSYEGVIYRCGLHDLIELDPDHRSPILAMEHVVMSSTKLIPTRFNSLYSEWFTTLQQGDIAGSDWATKYRCETSNVRNRQGLKLRVAQCWRRRPDLPGIYDLFVRTAILGAGRSGVVSTYAMDGTTRDNGLSLIRSVIDLTGRTR